MNFTINKNYISYRPGNTRRMLVANDNGGERRRVMEATDIGIPWLIVIAAVCVIVWCLFIRWLLS